MQKNEELCECEIIHEDTVKKVRAMFPKDEMIFDLADFYKIFGDTTRVKILYALDKSELCVCDISALLGMSVSAVSHQLRTLRDSRITCTHAGRSARSAFLIICSFPPFQYFRYSRIPHLHYSFTSMYLLKVRNPAAS